MDNPDISLTEIHRQAAGNPIIQFATEIRSGNDFYKFKSPNNNFTR
jgi:hypothetical protein